MVETETGSFGNAQPAQRSGAPSAAMIPVSSVSVPAADGHETRKP